MNNLRSNSSYGPLAWSGDTHVPQYKYFINVCSMSPDTCYLTQSTRVHAYACQETSAKLPNSNEYEGKDIGNVLAWYPSLLFRTFFFSFLMEQFFDKTQVPPSS